MENKGDLSDFEHGVVVGAGWADPLGCFRTTNSRNSRELHVKEKISSERQFCR